MVKMKIEKMAIRKVMIMVIVIFVDESLVKPTHTSYTAAADGNHDNDSDKFSGKPAHPKMPFSYNVSCVSTSSHLLIYN